MEFSKHNWVTISETSCPEMIIFGKQASQTLFHFYDVTLECSIQANPNVRMVWYPYSFMQFNVKVNFV